MTTSKPRIDAAIASIALALVAGCYSGLAATGGGGDGADDAATSGADDGGSSDGGDTPADAVPSPTLRRLTRAEFAHALVDLLGPVEVGAVEADSLQEGFFAVGAARVSLSPAGVALYEGVIADATAQAFSDPTLRAAIVPCAQTSADVACMQSTIASFGRRAWRRPLTDAEVTRYLDLAVEMTAETGDSLAGLRHAVWGLLQSPYFVYRIEIGAPDGDGRQRFSSWEMASRLAFTLWNTLPDDALLDAAAAGSLDDEAGITAQATRMLADPRAQQGVSNFAAELYGLWALDEKVKDEALYPDWTPTLKSVMRDELLARVRDVVFDAPGDYFSLYDGRKVFVNNELARIYGLPEVEPDAFRMAELPETDPRRGLVGSALVLAMNSLPARTSATERGQFISEILLCRTVPPPPPNVDTNLDDDADGGVPQHQTLREKLEPHRADPACAGCHELTDPLGLALEHFDTVGRYRETDQGLTIDASGELDGVAFDGAAELATVLRDDPAVPGCLVRKIYTYTAGRLPLPSEQDALDLLEGRLADEDNRFDRLLFALVTHDDFRFANPRGTIVAADGDKP